MRFHPYNKDEWRNEVPYIHHCAEEYGLQTVVIQCRSMQAEDIDVDTSEIQSKCEKKDRSALEIVKEVVIFPRRKAGQSKRQPDNQAPIKLTKEMLEDMFDVPLVAAAVKLGISKTALKNACRHLGLLQWPFRKRMQEAKKSADDEPDHEQDENVPKSSSTVPAWRDACTSNTNHATNLRIPPPVSFSLETPPPTWHHEKPKLDNQPDFSHLFACPSSSSATEDLHPPFQSFQHTKPGGKSFIGMESFHDETRSTEAPKDRFSCKLNDSSLKPMLVEDMQSQVEQLFNMTSLDDGNIGDIFGSLETSYNSRSSSPVYGDLRHEDVSESACKLCFVASSVASVTRMATALLKESSEDVLDVGITFSNHFDMSPEFNDEQA